MSLENLSLTDTCPGGRMAMFGRYIPEILKQSFLLSKVPPQSPHLPTNLLLAELLDNLHPPRQLHHRPTHARGGGGDLLHPHHHVLAVQPRLLRLQ